MSVFTVYVQVSSPSYALKHYISISRVLCFQTGNADFINAIVRERAEVRCVAWARSFCGAAVRCSLLRSRAAQRYLIREVGCFDSRLKNNNTAARHYN